MKQILLAALAAVLALTLALSGCQKVEDKTVTLGDLRFTVGGNWEEVSPTDDAALVYQPSYESQGLIALYLYSKEEGPYQSAQDCYDANFPQGAPQSPQEADFQRLEDGTVLGEPAYHVSFVVLPQKEEEGAFFVEQYVFESPGYVWVVALSIPESTPTASQVLRDLVEEAVVTDS